VVIGTSLWFGQSFWSFPENPIRIIKDFPLREVVIPDETRIPYFIQQTFDRLFARKTTFSACGGVILCLKTAYNQPFGRRIVTARAGK
jgi:hypothetical protein